MKTKHFFLATLLAGILITGTNSCGKSDSGDDNQQPADTYIPDLSAAPGWKNVAGSDFMFFSSISPAGTGVGTFTGSRQGSSDDGSFTGNANHSLLNLTFTDGNNSGRIFSGSIDHSGTPLVMTLTSPASGANPAITIKFSR